jgi:hypothetical protein
LNTHRHPWFFPVLAFLLTVPQPCGAQSRNSSAWSSLFEQAWQADQQGDPNRELQLIESGLAAVLSAGPKATGYVPGVATAAASYHHLGYTLQAEQVYVRAQEAARKLPAIRKDLAIDHALLFDTEQRQVASEAAWKEAVRIDEAQSHKSGLYSAELISLAIETEQVGHLSDAEAFYRRALSQPRPDMRAWPAPTLYVLGSRRIHLPIWDPRYALILFLEGHGRMSDAAQVSREGVTQASKEHHAFYELLYTLLEMDIANRDRHPQDADRLRNNLAPLIGPALATLDVNQEGRLALIWALLENGRGSDAIEFVRLNVEQAAKLSGKGSNDYAEALYDGAYELQQQGHLQEAGQALAELQRVATAFPARQAWLSTALVQQGALQKALGNSEEANRLSQESERVQAYGPDFPEETLRRFDDLVKGLNGRWNSMGNARPVDMKILQSAMAIAEQAPGKGALKLVDRVVQIAQWNPEPERRIVLDWRIREVARLAGPASDASIFALLGAAYNRPEMLDRAEHLIQSNRGNDSTQMENVLLDRTTFVQPPGQFEGKLALRRSLLKLKMDIYGEQSQDVAEEYARMAQFCDQSGHQEEGRPLWLASVDTSRKWTGGAGWQHSWNMDRAAITLAQHNGFEQAIAWNDEAVEAAKYDPNSSEEALKVRGQILELQRKASIQ